MTRIVDCHTHVIAPPGSGFPLDPIGGHRSEWSIKRPVDRDGLIAAMDEAGVAQAVVVQASTVHGHDNRYLAESVRAHPGRLVGVYSIDALAPDAVERIEHWQGQGLFGFRLFTTGTTMPGQSDWLGDPASFPAWAYAEAHGIPVCLQMTMAGLPTLRMLLERFPRARVLLDHLARVDASDGPPYALAAPLLEMARFPGVFLKLTHRTLHSAAENGGVADVFVRRVVAAFGAGRIAWGSNFPAAADLSGLLAEAQEALSDLPEADRAAIFGGTARQVYPALGEAAHG